MAPARLFGLFAFALLASAGAPGLVSAAAKAPRESSWVRLSRAGCYGPCPQYEVTVSDDGRVKWLGQWFVDRVGEFDSVVGARRARALVRAAARVPFERFASANDDLCPTDQTSARVHVHDEHGTDRDYFNYHGCRTPLVARGKRLERRIDRVARTTRWLSRRRPTCLVRHDNVHYQGDTDVAAYPAAELARGDHRRAVFDATVAGLRADSRLDAEVWTIGRPTAAQRRRVDAYRDALVSAGLDGRRIRTAVLDAHNAAPPGSMDDEMLLVATTSGPCLLRAASPGSDGVASAHAGASVD